MVWLIHFARLPVRARLPAKPMISVFEREPRPERMGVGEPDGGKVRARIPAKPMISVSGRELQTGRSGKCAPDGGKVRARLPAKPMISVFEREPGYPPIISSYYHGMLVLFYEHFALKSIINNILSKNLFQATNPSSKIKQNSNWLCMNFSLVLKC